MARGPAKQFDPDHALHQAMNVFWTKGYADSGLQELLGAMGISRKSLYDTFGNKRQLYLRALERYTENFVGRTVQILDANGSPLNNIRRALEQFAVTRGKAISKGCFIGVGMAQSVADDQEMASVLRDHLLKIEDAFARTLERALEAGELGSGISPRDLARTLTATTQGLAMRRRVDQDPDVTQSIVRSTLAMLDALSVHSGT